MNPLLQLDVEVASLGEDVKLSLGNCAWLLSFEAALILSAQMRRRANEVRAASGDISRIWGVTGTLHDAVRGPDADQPYTPGKVYPVARERLGAGRVGARSDGLLVAVKLGSVEAKMPATAALKISQWLRVRAKESKRRAGDVGRHWSQIQPQL